MAVQSPAQMMFYSSVIWKSVQEFLVCCILVLVWGFCVSIFKDMGFFSERAEGTL